jgi:hypothetical protein
MSNEIRDEIVFEQQNCYSPCMSKAKAKPFVYLAVFRCGHCSRPCPAVVISDRTLSPIELQQTVFAFRCRCNDLVEQRRGSQTELEIQQLPWNYEISSLPNILDRKS